MAENVLLSWQVQQKVLKPIREENKGDKAAQALGRALVKITRDAKTGSCKTCNWRHKYGHLFWDELSTQVDETQEDVKEVLQIRVPGFQDAFPNTTEGSSKPAAKRRSRALVTCPSWV